MGPSPLFDKSYAFVKHVCAESYAKETQFDDDRGLPSTFKGFLNQSDFNSYSYQVSPSIFSGF